MIADDEDADLQRALAMSLQNPPPSQQQNPKGEEQGEQINAVEATTPTTDDEEDDDADLAAALKLSLQKVGEDEDTAGATPAPASSHSALDPIPQIDPSLLSPRVQQWYATASPTNILNCHFILWDASVTHRNDQERWLAQGIAFKSRQADPDVHPAAQHSLLGAIICHPELWGLTQSHGGPCGVLASLQAELMRLLLFGPRTLDDLLPVHIPTQLTNHFCQAKPDLSPSFLTKALALSIGVVLARAALQPSASWNDDEGEQKRDNNDNDDEVVEPHHSFMLSGSVKLVLPKPGNQQDCRQLEWYHLEPWSGGAGGDAGAGHSEHLVTYTISLDDDTELSTNDSNNKRQKRLSSKLQERQELLAQAVAAFLLETKAIEWYHRQGGVLLFVLALVESRGVAQMQGDMDDPTARLTSQFGHCSQELINLLLTGQAVSNVFDHTLRPSGELVCRGIQQRPVIGYLSLLESMRYLEVGGYYKTPQFPIWVVGSTSHFTIMFGDAACLKESASDQILERVRRAFKQMDGGEEQGFLQVDQLGDFIRKLDLYDRLGDHGVQTLGATMEVTGAGILLWEDVWKRVSRLLMGASLQAVLNMDDTAATSASASAETSDSKPPEAARRTTSEQAAMPPPLLSAASSEGPLTDEDYARLLQAELNGELIPPQTTPKRASSPSITGSVASSTNTTTTTTNANQHKEQFGDTFQLYHYNGLRGGHMKAFRVTRLSSEEAIGASVSLGTAPSSSGGGGGMGHGSPAGLDDILRTKWPSCKIDWLGGSPPSVD